MHLAQDSSQDHQGSSAKPLRKEGCGRTGHNKALGRVRSRQLDTQIEPQPNYRYSNPAAHHCLPLAHFADPFLLHSDPDLGHKSPTFEKTFNILKEGNLAQHVVMTPTPPSTTSSHSGQSPDQNFRVVRKRNRVPLSCAPCRHRK